MGGQHRHWHQADVRRSAVDSEDAAMTTPHGDSRDGSESRAVNAARSPARSSGSTAQAPASDSAATAPPSPPGEPESAPGEPLRLSMAIRQLDKWLNAMERLRLEEYVRYVDDRKRLFWTSFWGGAARGVGMAVGFTILGAVLVLILQNLARHNLPVIGDFLAQIVNVVQTRLK